MGEKRTSLVEGGWGPKKTRFLRWRRFRMSQSSSPSNVHPLYDAEQFSRVHHESRVDLAKLRARQRAKEDAKDAGESCLTVLCCCFCIPSLLGRLNRGEA